MVTAVLRESGCERGGRAAILVQYESIFIEIALFWYSTGKKTPLWYRYCSVSRLPPVSLNR